MFEIGTPISPRPVTTIHMAPRQLTHMFATMNSSTRTYPVKRVLREQADQARPLDKIPESHALVLLDRILFVTSS
jgi:hypothetical protein